MDLIQGKRELYHPSWEDYIISGNDYVVYILYKMFIYESML